MNNKELQERVLKEVMKREENKTGVYDIEKTTKRMLKKAIQLTIAEKDAETMELLRQNNVWLNKELNEQDAEVKKVIEDRMDNLDNKYANGRVKRELKNILQKLGLEDRK